MPRAEILIHGKVQGVFFRKFVKENAVNLNLKGYSKNIDNDKVEVIAEGDLNNIKILIEICENGPNASVVKKVDVSFKKEKNEFDNFEIKY